ncbi:MAG: hypothetical protein K1X94_29405 [Sandaracinaceae bacterium]|nr:hypothetical protein [Sandaracinaceae bacterium]
MPSEPSTLRVRWFYPGRARFDHRRRRLAPAELAALVALARAAGVVPRTFRAGVTKRRPLATVERGLYSSAARWLRDRGWETDIGALAAVREVRGHVVVLGLFDAVLDELERAGRLDAVLERAAPAARVSARPRVRVQAVAA